MTDSSSKMELEDEAVHVALTYDHLDVVPIMNRVRSPKAGAIVLFAGEVHSTMSL
jgi:molybdopterin synthase catalytic subunit